VSGFVVGWDGNIDEFKGSVGITESNDSGEVLARIDKHLMGASSRDVDVGSLSDSLVVDSGVGDDDDSGLFE